MGRWDCMFRDWIRLDKMSCVDIGWDKMGWDGIG
jgi:hypothetical protein